MSAQPADLLMSHSRGSRSAAGWRSRPARIAFVVVCTAAIVVQWVTFRHVPFTRAGDFALSREFGRRFLAGEDLYANGLHYPYMASAAMLFSPLAFFGLKTALALRYATALASLYATLTMLYRMAAQVDSRIRGRSFELATLTLILASHYVIRDLDDGGPHLILLAILVGAVYAFRRAMPVASGVAYGLATAFKANCAIFLAYFAWKRQWRLLAYSVALTAFWIVLPSAWMGPGKWYEAQARWTDVAMRSAIGHPIPGADESERRSENQALRPALVFFASGFALPNPESEGRKTVSPASSLAASAGIGALLVLFGWVTLRPLSGAGDPRLLFESSGVMVLAVLLSPVTWVQHLVLVIPALYLLLAHHRCVAPLPQPARIAMGVYIVLTLALNRELLGKPVYSVLLAYRIHTLAMLIVLGLLMWIKPLTERQSDAP